MSEHIGPSLWHGREVNSCTRCKYLKCHLVKSGRRPDYEYYCLHPAIMNSEVIVGAFPSERFMVMVKEKFPDKWESMVARWNEQEEQRKANRAKHGEFISNDSYTPETPEWCPVLRIKNTETV